MIDEIPANPLPKIQRRKNRIGQEHGPFFIKVGNRKVNLKSENYIVARERAREAYYDGKVDFQDQRFFDSSTSTPETPKPLPTSSEWTNDVVGAAASGLKPDQYQSPRGESVPLLNPIPSIEGDGPTIESPKVEGGKPGDDSTQIPPEMFKGMLKQLAEIAVELQIQGQEWLFKRYAKRQPGPVPMNNLGRTASTEMWERQFEKWVPSDVPLPEWIVAPLLCAMLTLPVQLEGSRPLAKDVPAQS